MNRQRYLELIAPALDLVSKKGEDYNALVKLHDYFPFGHKSYIQMVHVKATRLRSLSEVAEPNFDSIEDTLLDLLNYTVFYLDFLKGTGNEQF